MKKKGRALRGLSVCDVSGSSRHSSIQYQAPQPTRLKRAQRGDQPAHRAAASALAGLAVIATVVTAAAGITVIVTITITGVVTVTGIVGRARGAVVVA